MSVSTLRLLSNYRQQEQAYQAVLELAHQSADALREGLPLDALHRINEQKRELLQQVARLERQAEVDQADWRRQPRAGRPGVELEALLARITSLIEQILRQEHETELWIEHGAGLRQVAPEAG